MTKTSDDSQEEFAFAGEIAARISKARDEFFIFMKSYDEDLASLDLSETDPALDAPIDRCLIYFFKEWVSSYERAYEGPEKQLWVQFNQLLPHILLAVVEESLRYPDLLDASPYNPDGTLRRRFRRSIACIFETKIDRSETLRKSPDWDQHGDELIMYGMLFEPFPPIEKTEFD